MGNGSGLSRGDFRSSLRWPRRVRLDPLLPITCAVLALLGTIAQINPVWLIGPYQPGSITSGAVPDWYMGFLDGPLRLMPAWELSVGGHPLDLGVLIPGLVVPAVFFTRLALYPLTDRWIVGAAAAWAAAAHASRPGEPHRGGRVRRHVLWPAVGRGSQRPDRLPPADPSLHGHLIFRVLVLAGPPLAFLITRAICHALADRRRDEGLYGRETGRIVMNPEGGYTEIREPARLAAPPGADPLGPTVAGPGYVAARHPAA